MASSRIQYLTRTAGELSNEEVAHIIGEEGPRAVVGSVLGIPRHLIQACDHDSIVAMATTQAMTADNLARQYEAKARAQDTKVRLLHIAMKLLQAEKTLMS